MLQVHLFKPLPLLHSLDVLLDPPVHKLFQQVSVFLQDLSIASQILLGNVGKLDPCRLLSAPAGESLDLILHRIVHVDDSNDKQQHLLLINILHPH